MNELSALKDFLQFSQNMIAQESLKEDGTAFFGKSGRGRIEFDGTKGTIFSAFYENGNGMKIDLDNAVIDMRQTGGYAQVENPTPESWSSTSFTAVLLPRASNTLLCCKSSSFKNSL